MQSAELRRFLPPMGVKNFIKSYTGQWKSKKKKKKMQKYDRMKIFDLKGENPP